MPIEITETQRGFAVAEFTDEYGHKCSIQKSSLVEPQCIWLGVDDPNPQILARDTPQGGNGWVPFHIPKEVSLTTRMHLSQEQVAALLPLLQRFVETGELS
jgi:hypothetical protein